MGAARTDIMGPELALIAGHIASLTPRAGASARLLHDYVGVANDWELPPPGDGPDDPAPAPPTATDGPSASSDRNPPTRTFRGVRLFEGAIRPDAV